MNPHFLFKLSMSFVIIIGLISCKSNSSTVTYNLISSVEPSQAGAISPASGEFEDGEVISVTATANENWEFVEWGGDLSGTSNPASVTIDDNKTISASFKLKEYPLTVNIEGGGSVTETLVQTKSTDYIFGSVVELLAESEEGWSFIEWQDDLSGNENPIQITVDGEKTVTGFFEFGFEEDFNSGNNGMWVTTEHAIITNGVLQIEGPVPPSDSWQGAYYNKVIPDNFRAELEVSRIAPDKSLNTLGFFYALSNSLDSRYQIGITQEGGNRGQFSVFAIDTSNDPVFTTIIDWREESSIINTEPGAINRIVVNLADGQVDVFINGTYIASFQDDQLEGGFIGLYTYDEDRSESGGQNIVTYDNITITLPDDPVAKAKIIPASKGKTSKEGPTKARANN